MLYSITATQTSAISTLSLHDALPISDLGRPLPGPLGPHAALPGQGRGVQEQVPRQALPRGRADPGLPDSRDAMLRSEEHTSELQSRPHLVCRLLLEKKKKVYRPDVRH